MAQFDSITSDRYPYLNLRVQIRGWRDSAYALIDTGFTGNLVVPEIFWTRELGQADSRVNWILGDGGTVRAPVYIGDVEIFGTPLISAVGITFLGNEYILGRGVIDRYRVTFDHGERVIVEA